MQDIAVSLACVGGHAAGRAAVTNALAKHDFSWLEVASAILTTTTTTSLLSLSLSLSSSSLPR